MEQLNTIISNTFTNYKGCIIEKCKEGHKWNGRVFPDWEAVTGQIDKGVKLFINQSKK